MAVKNEFRHVKRAEEIKKQLNVKFAFEALIWRQPKTRFPALDHEVH